MQGRKRNRMQNFDYSSDAIYFITICTKNRVHYFGKIQEDKMVLNDLGIITEHQILWLQEHYPYCEMHNFVVMPNHVHLLLRIDSTNMTESNIKIKSVSSLVGAFKTTSSKLIHLAGNTAFEWQRSFHDHIVRCTETYERIDHYIANNPENWAKDKFKNEK